MDALLEMTPGTGWLARELDRIVFLPGAETIEVAHDVIEPLLVPRSSDEAFGVLSEWIRDGRPLPPVLLVAVAPAPRVLSSGIPALAVEDPAHPALDHVPIAPTDVPTQLGRVRTIALQDDTGSASGMLVEGVIRAGGFRLRLHQRPETPAPPTGPAEREDPSWSLLLGDGHEIAVGSGVVLGRWPYRHQAFDDRLDPVVVSDPTVSRLHAEVLPQDGGLVVIDRESHNGTSVIEGRTNRRHTLEPGVAFSLHPGDQLVLGDSTITVGGAEPAL